MEWPLVFQGEWVRPPEEPEVKEGDVWCEWCGEGPWKGDTEYEHFCSQECRESWYNHVGIEVTE